MSVVETPASPAAAPASPAPAAPVAAPAEVVNDGLKNADAAPAPLEGEAKPEPKPEKPESRDTTGRDRRKLSRLYREAAEWKAKAEFFERQTQELKPKEADPHAPRLESFSDIEEYATAKAKYESEKALKDHSAKQHAETQKQYAARIAGEWEERVERAVEKYDDFAEVVGEIKPTNPLSVAIMRAPNGEDLAYHLGKNPKEAQRIVGLDPVSQIFELGQLSAKLAAEPKKPPQPSKAPAPINPLSGGANQPSNEPDPSDVGNWVKWRQRQVHGARR